jgi:hypothetical protein
MTIAYLVFAALSFSVYALTFRLRRDRRLIIALLVFAVTSGAFTVWVAKRIDDRPAPGDVPYHPSTH